MVPFIFSFFFHLVEKNLLRVKKFSQGSYSFELFKFQDFPWLFPWPFPWPFQVFQDVMFNCQFQKFKTLACFKAFIYLEQFNRNKLWCSPKCVPFKLLNYSSLSYIVLALSSAVNNLSNKTFIFHDFQGPTIKFHDFPGLETKLFNSMTFQVPWPVRTLSKCCENDSACLRKGKLRRRDIAPNWGAVKQPTKNKANNNSSS